MVDQPLSVSVSGDSGTPGGIVQAQDAVDSPDSSSTSIGPLSLDFADDHNRVPPKPPSPAVADCSAAKSGGPLRRQLKRSCLYGKLLRRDDRRLPEKSELGPLFFTTLATMTVILGSFHNFGLISNNCMENLLIVQGFSLLLLTGAHLLQHRIITVVVMFLGVGSVLASFYTVILMALPKEKRWPVHFIVFPCFGCLGLYKAYEVLMELIDEANKDQAEGVSGGVAKV